MHYAKLVHYATLMHHSILMHCAKLVSTNSVITIPTIFVESLNKIATTIYLQYIQLP